jgi:hypothetical protein
MERALLLPTNKRAKFAGGNARDSKYVKILPGLGDSINPRNLILLSGESVCGDTVKV